MSELSVTETLLRFGTFGPLQFGNALSAAAEAQRLRGAYEQFVAAKNRQSDIDINWISAVNAFQPPSQPADR
jgi:hypothetical protein